jgi:hypothetical protein
MSRFLTEFKKTATKTFCVSESMEKTRVTIFSPNYFRECFKAWNACMELYGVSNGDYFEGITCKCENVSNKVIFSN